MKRNENAGKYLHQYEGTAVTITDVTFFGSPSSHGLPGVCVAFDLSDGSHWFSDDMDTVAVRESLTEANDLVYDELNGWTVVNDDGSRAQIPWA